MPKKSNKICKFESKEQMIDFLKSKMTEQQFAKFTSLLEEGHSCHSANKELLKQKF